jgi:nitrogen fixation/metabolism regulation signal transduction histidine kinase
MRSGVQKRLFLFLFPMMFLPAVVVILVDWNTSRQHLTVLDSPGLNNSFDASLELARRVLEEEKSKTRDLAVSLAHSITAREQQPHSVSWWLVEKNDHGGWNSLHGSGDELIVQETGDPAAFSKGLRQKNSQETLLLASAPIPDEPGTWVIVSRPMDADLNQLLDQVTRGGAGFRQLRLFYSRLLRSNLLLTLGVMTVILFLLSFWLSRRFARYVARPLEELSLGTEKVAAGDLGFRVEVKAPAELGKLVQAFNGMTEQLQQSRSELRRAERIAAWQGVARRLAHEIKNPLTPITLAMHRIGKKSDDETVQSCVRTVLEESANLGRLADEFSMYAKLPKPHQQALTAHELYELLESVANFYLARTRVQYQWQGWPGNFSLSVDVGQLRQVLSNLIKNGNEAMDGQGTLYFELENVSIPGHPIKTEHEGPWMRLTIRDSGPGLSIDPEEVFEPYVTSKATGTGLGLAVSRRMVQDNGGSLWATSSPLGASFILELPQVQSAQGDQRERTQS